MPLLQLTLPATVAAQDGTWLDCKETDTCALLAAHDADQESHPFLFNGHVVDPSFPRWPEFARAIAEFPDVRSCLIEREHDAHQPNVLHIDWDRVGTDAAGRVCIFRIGASLENARDLRNWFEFHDFRVLGWHGPYSYGSNVTRLEAHWTVEQWRAVDPNLIYSLTGWTTARSFGISVGLDENDAIIAVSASGSTILN